MAGRGEVRVRVLASGIEYTDTVIRQNLYAQTMFRRPPFVMGYDGVGEIDRLGDGVSGFQIGDRVSPLVDASSPPVVRPAESGRKAVLSRPSASGRSMWRSGLEDSRESRRHR
jgi:NADPH:quinone reductase-like Zn-dependent oxidoreductase